MDIQVKKFKKIDGEAVTLKPINIFIGANNAGKSSFIQGIQFAISSCQTLELEKTSWTKTGARTLSLDSNDFLYTPTKNIEFLYHGKKLTGAKTRQTRCHIEFSFLNDGDKATLKISKGKNGGFTTTVEGRVLGEKLSNINKPFCVYVPGIAGIPTQEKHEVPITVKKSATRGDSNSYLRNILLDISTKKHKWDAFLGSVNAIYDQTTLSANFDGHMSEYIDVNVKMGDLDLPLDAVGTGLLQVIQIFAYIEYFDPTIILLDEPDSHIHPTKQKLLALELVKKTSKNKDLKIVCSTHSRYILDALDAHANVVHFQDGKLYQNVKNSSILIDIGAADADYLFKKKKLKYVIATEDKVDNVSEKKEFLKNFALANGLHEDEFVLHSYHGCTKVDFAQILEGFVRKHIPTASVILHIDRDQKIETDRELVQLRNDCIERKIGLFVTKFQEIEAYFCSPKHISTIYNITLESATERYEQFVKELETSAIKKLRNFILRERIDLALNKNKQKDVTVIDSMALEWYTDNKYQFTPGKELLRKIKSYVQKDLKADPNLIVNVSDALWCEEFQACLKQ